ncbi:MAG: hypothetical protein RL757_1272 [Bacteroidota bacterium]|jgi:hypothetical protein
MTTQKVSRAEPVREAFYLFLKNVFLFYFLFYICDVILFFLQTKRKFFYDEENCIFIFFDVF